VLGLEARFRRADLLVNDKAVFSFFDQRIPADITSTRHFDAWWKKARREGPTLLDLSIEDLIDPAAAPLDEEAFPELWHHGDVEMPLGYEFDPDSPTDGVTVVVPVSGLERIDPAVFEWHVPGLREQLIVALIRSLPKRIRKLFAPIPETARSLLAGGVPTDVGLVEHLRGELGRMGSVVIPPDAFDLEGLPAHLRPVFQVVDEDGRVLAQGRDMAALKSDLLEEARATASVTNHEVEQSGLTTWSFGELPEVVELEGPGRTVQAYPAVIDEGNSVSVRLLATATEQAEATWVGVRRLLLLNLPSPGRLLRPLQTEDAKLALATGPYDDADGWAEDCLTGALDDLLIEAGGPPRDAVAFDALLDRARNELSDRLTVVAEGSLRVLSMLRMVRGGLDAAGSRFPDAVSDMRLQIRRLIYPGFVTGIGADRLPDVHRYLHAIERRLERLAEHPSRDRELMIHLQTLEAEHDRLQEVLPPSPQMVDIAWMLQELRVSLFAQALGTRGKVSEKRIETALSELPTTG
jgi:ATP-dependent helicase HrpA